MISIFNFLQYQLNDLSLMTEFLESCNWDEEERNEKIQIVLDYFECHPFPSPGADFNDWLNKTVKKNLIECGLTNQQAKIVLALIINSKDEILTQLNLPEH